MLHEDMGPYRIEAQLGTGGMGEVYKAWDSRLDRWVALKIVRPDAIESMKARERFRREARAAAGLSHPSVVQIHDILERDDGDCIVMELVEGRSLAELLQEGPLELERAVRLGREIAEGLASAHAKDVVHRDLKAENVMITADDHPKILDFGLAKRLHPETPEATLSIDGRVVGTGYAMSPEQAQGFDVDHRSDLFSLGTLLYQMVTGVSPFRRPTLAETLTRVCVHQQTPAAEVRPEVPGELSVLIDRLLAKKPEDRPHSTPEVVAALRRLEPSLSTTLDPVAQPTLVDLPRVSGTMPGSLTTGTAPGVPAQVSEERESAWSRALEPLQSRRTWLTALLVLAVAAVALWALRPSPPPPLLVAVPEPEVTDPGQVQDVALLVSGVRVAILEGLMDLQGVTVLAPDQVDAVGGTSQQIVRATAADEVVPARLSCSGLGCRLELSRVGMEGRLLATRAFEVTADDLLLVANLVQDRAQGLYDGYRRRSGEQDAFRIGREQYEEFLRLRERVVNRDQGVGLEELLEEATVLRRRAPRFLPAYQLEAWIARMLYVDSHQSGYLDHALEVIDQAREIAPDSPQPLFALADAGLDGRRPELVEEAVAELEERLPGSTEVLARKARLREEQGEAEEGLELMRRVVERRPSVKNYYRLANMELRQGEMEAAREHCQRLLALQPGHVDGKSVLALVEILSGSVDRAVELYEELVRMSPESGLYINLGVAYMLQGRYEEAAETFRKARQQEPRSPFALLNLADAELLVGRQGEAERLYRELLELTAEDPGDWQMLSMRAQALAHLGESRRAVGRIQQALREAGSDNPQAAYEAAVVYAVVGDTNSALANVERALELGIEGVWFGFPWFDRLRDDPDYQALFGDSPQGEA